MIKRLISLITVLSLSLSFILLLCSCERKPNETKTVDEGYTLYENVSYGDDVRHTLDLCIPDGAGGEVGLVLFIHGGGWHAGEKDVYKNELIKWAKTNGYVAAALNYRYASDKVHADGILSDITAALAKIKARAADVGISTEKVLLTGGSAGGHLSLLYAYKVGNDAPIKPSCVVSYAGPTSLDDSNYFGSNPLVDDIIKMFRKISGYNVDKNNLAPATAALREVSPLTYVSESSPPTVICHGDSDEVVPISNAYALEAALTEAGVENRLIVYTASGHGLDGDSAAAKLAEEVMLEYARTHLGR